MNNWKHDLTCLLEQDTSLQESKILTMLPHELRETWENFMRGKTCPILNSGDHGVYSWDLKQFLQKV